MVDSRQRGLIDAAFAFHQQGRIDEARALYAQILALDPKQFDALHLSGVAEMQAGRPAVALEKFEQALAVDSRSAAAWVNTGRAQERLGRQEEACSAYQRALSLNPEDADLHFRLGGLQRKRGDHASAVSSFREALRIRPGFARASFNEGNALLDLGLLDEAVESYRRAIGQDPAFADAHFNLGTLLLRMNRAAEAVLAFDAAIALRPDNLDAWVNKGNALRDLGKNDEAVRAYDQAIAFAPHRPEAFNNKAAAFLEMGQVEAALDCFERAIAMDPQASTYHLGKAGALRKLGRLDDALASFDRAIALAPQDVDAHSSRSLCRLLQGDLRQGFEEYEWRWQSADLADSRPSYPQPLWLGRESIAGKRILLRWEQGLGDTIQFARYAALLGERGAHVILVVQPPLLPLFQRLAGGGELLAEGAPLPPFDLHCPLLSLPLALGTDLNSIPSAPRYIFADPDKVAAWARRLGPQRRPRIGLAWSGRPEHRHDGSRSIALETLLSAFPGGFELVVLQKEIREADQRVLDSRPEIRHFASDLVDFSDTAALCECMDLVVSVDTSIAHLAGALGKPLWVLLPFLPDWRWLMARSDSPWYPSARLFRQPRPDAWSNVLAALRQRLIEVSIEGFRTALR